MTQVLAIALALLFSIPSPADVRRAVRKVLANGDFQTELPGETGYTNWQPPEWEATDEPVPVEDTWDWSPTESEDWDPPPPRDNTGTIDVDVDTGGRGGGGSAPALGNALLWVLLIVTVGVAGVWIARALSGYTRDAKVKAGPTTAARPPPAELERPKTEAERLAEAGAFGEAIHVLLLQTLGELSRHLPGGIRKSYTSREIVSRIDMPESARPHLEGLVSAVEISLFGYDVPSGADYAGCVEHFERFAAAYRAAGATA